MDAFLTLAVAVEYGNLDLTMLAGVLAYGLVSLAA
jgi:hypothetical protein